MTSGADDLRAGPRTPDLGARQPKAIHSALTVLEEIARSGPGTTARQVSDALGLPRATAYRLLNLLVQEEYLVRLPDLSGFALSRKVAALAAAAEPEPAVGAAGHEAMSRLRLRFRGGVTLADLRDDRIRLVDTDPDFPLSDPRRLVDDPASSAIGRLLLLERGRLRGETPPPSIERLADGVTVQSGSFRRGFGCAAMPVRAADGRLVAALAVSASASQLADPEPILAFLGEGSSMLRPLLSA